MKYIGILTPVKLKKIKSFWLLLIILCITLSMCDMDNHKLILINNANKSYHYRLLADTSDLKKGLYVYPISAHDTVRPLFVRGGEGAWEYQINHYSPDSTLNIYLFDDSILTEEIIKQRKFKKLTYRVKDLEV